MGKTKDVREAVESELIFDPLVDAAANNGNLTLTGIVKYGSERAAAELTAAGLTGVRNIRNDIQISNDADLIDVTVLVQDALDRYALIPDDSDVVVDAAWMASGVYDVRDELYITG
jgi:BON domain